MSAALAADIAVSTAAHFDFDSRGTYNAPRGESVALPFGDGATVTATAPGGAVETLAPAVNGTNLWTALSGGRWTLSNSNEGSVEFWVRYAGVEQGAGTEASPWKLVDDTELGELINAGDATDGFFFVTEGPLSSIAQMFCPAAYLARPLAERLYELVAAPAGTHGVSLAAPLRIDTMQEGPDRRVRSTEAPLPFAFSGDDWAFSPSASSTLTFTSPAGSVTTVGCEGTATLPFLLTSRGVWTVTLSGASATPITALIDWTSSGTTMIVR